LGQKPKILVVDDNPQNVQIMKARLSTQDYDIIEAFDGEQALKKVEEQDPDLILLDVMMPKMDGFQVCQKLKSDDKTKLIPIIIVSARAGTEDILKGLELGADEYLPKPYEHVELLARVKNMLKLRIAQKDLQELNNTLEEKVRKQVALLESEKRLERYLNPQVVDMIMKGGELSKMMNSRKLLTLFVSDINNFSGISERTEPEDVVALLNNYFSSMSDIVFKYGGTLDKFLGDGLLVFFGDPMPYEDHAQRAINMALEMKEKVEELRKDWKAAGHDLDITVGINTGFATVGNMGSEKRLEYTVIGNQVNLAFRLCAEAKPGQIVISQRTYSLVEKDFAIEKIGDVTVKGIITPVTIYNVTGKK